MTVQPRSVLITVPTYKRPERLARLLTALNAQRLALPPAVASAVAISIVAIDNDPEESAREVATTAGVRYVTEPARGLAAVRNHALKEASGADALIFIDDDETPDPGWLHALLTPWLAGSADFVSGEVYSTFETPPDPWIEAGGFFHRVRFRAGMHMRAAATNNLLIDIAFVHAHGLAFDTRFGETGGEDIHFTAEATTLGARIVSAPTARVQDPVPASRTNRAWVLRRAYRVGTTTVRSDLLLTTSRLRRASRRVHWFAVGAVRTGAGCGRWLLGVFSRSLRHQARGARLMARGAGMAAGALGLQYREYVVRKKH